MASTTTTNAGQDQITEVDPDIDPSTGSGSSLPITPTSSDTVLSTTNLKDTGIPRKSRF